MICVQVTYVNRGLSCSSKERIIPVVNIALTFKQYVSDQSTSSAAGTFRRIPETPDRYVASARVAAQEAYVLLSTAFSDLSTAVQTRERLEAQQQENLGVKKVSPNLLASFAS